jgi:DmsE family decaheme c-type cytochrome
MKYIVSTRRKCVWAIAFILLFSAATAVAVEKEKKTEAQPASADQGKFAGTDQCKICHEDQARMMQGTPHYRIFGSETKAGAEGCENCHGGGLAHIEGGGDRTKISRLGGVKPSDASAVCMGCHKDRADHAHFNRSVHARAGVSCVDCHRVHRAKTDPLLSEKDPYLCYTCHQDKKGDFNKPFHHRVEEGLVKCTDCHNVHGATTEKQLRTTKNQDRICYQCHSDKRGPFVYEHEPVRSEGCTSCHTPHGSSNAHMLSRSTTNAVCLECHSGLPSGPHPQNTARQSCTLCHVRIHGSNSSSTFFK